MKKIVFAALLLASVSGFAQDKKEKTEGPRGHKTERVTPEEQSKQLASELKLDAKQQEKIKTLYTDQEKKRAQNRPEGDKKPEGEKPNRAEFDAKMKKENEEFDSKMKEILTKDQYKQWQKSNKAGGPGEKRAAKKGSPKKDS